MLNPSYLNILIERPLVVESVLLCIIFVCCIFSASYGADNCFQQQTNEGTCCPVQSHTEVLETEELHLLRGIHTQSLSAKQKTKTKIC